MTSGYWFKYTFQSRYTHRQIWPTVLIALLLYFENLICSPNKKKQCDVDIVMLQMRHKVCLSRVKQQNNFLGHVITAKGNSLSPNCVEMIHKTAKPVTKKQVSFLGMCFYSLTFIPNYVVLETPLCTLLFMGNWASFFFVSFKTCSAVCNHLGSGWPHQVFHTDS